MVRKKSIERSDEQSNSVASWLRSVFVAAAAAALAVMYHLYAETAAENEELRQKLTKVLELDHSATERAQKAMAEAEKLGKSWPLQALAVLQEELIQIWHPCSEVNSGHTTPIL